MAKTGSNKYNPRTKPLRRAQKESNNTTPKLAQRELERRIKNCLQTKRQYDDKTISSLKRSLSKADDYLIELQNTEKPHYRGLLVKVTIENGVGIIRSYEKLIPILSKLGSVIILPTKYLPDSLMNPINTWCVLAEEGRAMLLVYYLKHIHTTIEGVVMCLTREHRLVARQVRRKHRRDQKAPPILQNTKSFSSELRETLIKDIVNYLESHYNNREVDHRTIIINNINHIKTRLKNKYGKSWKAKLTTS